MTDIITAPDMATTWQPTLTRKEAKGRGIPGKSYRRLVSWAQMVVHYHQSEGARSSKGDQRGPVGGWRLERLFVIASFQVPLAR